MADGEGEGRGLIGYFVRHRTAANLLMILVVVLGTVSAVSLRRQLLPDVEVPTATVRVDWRGAGVEQMDRAVLSVLDAALARTPGATRRVGAAADNRATLTLEFEPGVDIDRAVAEIRATLDGLTTLPRGADPPRVTPGARGERIADFLVHGPASHSRLVVYADELRRRFFEANMSRHWVTSQPSVMLSVETPEEALIRHDLSMREIADAVAEAVRQTPSGFADRGATRVTTGIERRSVEALAALPLRRDPDGGVLVRLGDIAEMRDVGRDRGVRHYVDGDPALIIRMDRQTGRDGIEQLAEARRIAEDYAATLPEGVRIEAIRAWMSTIDRRLTLLVDNAVVGLGVVLALLFLFLSPRAALWVAAGIPISLLGALAGMWALGISLNLISVFALIIMLGIVVDDAIVVGDHADVLARRGLPPALAAERAARRMAGPVFAASITTAIAFGGILVIGGRFGEMLQDLPLTVALVLAASLVECFLILPAHMAHSRAAPGRPTRWTRISGAVNRAFDRFNDRAFRPALTQVVRWRYPSLGLAVFLLLGAVQGIVEDEPPWRFWLSPERDTFSVSVAMIDSADREDTEAQVALVEDAVRRVLDGFEAETGVSALAYMVATVGANADHGLLIAEGKASRLLGGVDVELVPAEDRPFRIDEVVARIRDATERHPLVEAVAFRPERGGPAGDALSVAFEGAEPGDLKAAAEALKAATRRWPEIVGVEDTLPYGRDEVTLALTPLARHLGFTEERLAVELAGRFTSIEAAEMEIDGRTATILVGPAREDRTADRRRETLVRTPAGGWAPLDVLTEAEARPGFQSVRRVDGRLVAEVKGDVATTDALRLAEIERDLRERVLPDLAARHGVEWRMAGLAAQERRFLQEAPIGFLLGLVGIYLVLAWVFASWTRPFVVLLVVPFGLVGAVQGHVWMDLPLSMFSVVGLIGMTGIIVNDSIVLVTAVDEEARRRALVPAVIEATCGRLRPVVLTTLTTVLGLAPLLLEQSRDAEALRPTVVTLVFGLGFGLLLVLMVTPALVLLQRDLGAALASLRRLARLALRRRRGLGAP
jgi:multidrug efflux pump subunit AcrB